MTGYGLHYKTIIDQFSYITKVIANDYNISVYGKNRNDFDLNIDCEYKNRDVAKAVKKKLDNFIGLKLI